ncbi:MAG: 30S ribosomal protein S20 [Epulopiscium sp.]|nr:30S ribosomal protein S20 [Candidatus Epulonipiscium sp.]
MANIKSAKKRIRVTETKTARNKSIRSAVKTEIKKVNTAVENKDSEEAKKALEGAVSAIDKATSKGIFHKNTAARKKSTLTKQVNQL